MKSKPTVSLIVAAGGLACLAFVSVIPFAGLAPSSVQAQTAGVQGLVVPSSPPQASRMEQYKVVDIGTVSITRAPGGAVGTLELLLNELATEGWRLRSNIGNYLIFAR